MHLVYSLWYTLERRHCLKTGSARTYPAQPSRWQQPVIAVIMLIQLHHLSHFCELYHTNREATWKWMGRDKVKEAVVGVRTKYCPSSRAGPAFLGITRFNHIGVLPSADHDCSSVSINAQKYSKRRITASLFAHTKQHTPCASYAVGVLYRPTIGYIQLNYRQARREPQRGLGKHYRGALSQTHSVGLCADMRRRKKEREEIGA